MSWDHDGERVSGFLVEHGDTLDPHRMTATSGDAGVTLLVDGQEVHWLRAGAYGVLVSVWLTSTRTYAASTSGTMPP